jgi:hypothetical protein
MHSSYLRLGQAKFICHCEGVALLAPQPKQSPVFKRVYGNLKLGDCFGRSSPALPGTVRQDGVRQVQVSTSLRTCPRNNRWQWEQMIFAVRLILDS